MYMKFANMSIIANIYEHNQNVWRQTLYLTTYVHRNKTHLIAVQNSSILVYSSQKSLNSVIVSYIDQILWARDIDVDSELCNEMIWKVCTDLNNN